MNSITREQMDNQPAINQIMLTTAKVINEGLKNDILDYEDIIHHNFAKDAGYKDIYPEQEYLMTPEEAIKEAKKILPAIYEMLKSYCKGVIRKKVKLVMQTNINDLYNIYNDGKCLPEKMSKKYLVEEDQAYIDKIATTLPIPIQYDIHIQPMISDNHFASTKVANFAINCLDKMTIDLIGHCCIVIKNTIKELLTMTEEEIVDKILMALLENSI